MTAASGQPPSLPRLTLVLGGARSGKSAYAQRLVEPRPAIYLATAEPLDDEMAARIGRHRSDRGATWETIEEPLALAETLVALSGSDRPVLVDCLTLWLSNLMLAGRDPPAETARLIAALAGATGPIVLVANEVGLGIVPDNALARAFRDAAGRLNQEIAAAADQVVLLAAGLPLALKDGAGPSRRAD